MPSSSQSARTTASVSVLVKPGISSIESSRKKAHATSVVNAARRAAVYFSSRTFILHIERHTYAMISSRRVASISTPAAATRAASAGRTAAGTSAATYAVAAAPRGSSDAGVISSCVVQERARAGERERDA